MSNEKAAVSRYAKVLFTDGCGESSWEYEIPRWVSGVQEGSTVVCDYEGELKIGTVKSVSAGADFRTHCRIVCTVPVEEYRTNVHDEAERKALMERMAERKAELDALSGFEELKADPEMAELLSSFAAGCAEDRDAE